MYSSVTYSEVSINSDFCIRQPGDFRTYYSEAGLHRPDSMFDDYVTGRVLFSFSDVTPHLGEELSVLRIPFSIVKESTIDPDTQEPVVTSDNTRTMLDNLETMDFICLKAGSGDVRSRYRWMYGWIDDYRIIGSGGPQSVVEIYWHLDYYLTYGVIQGSSSDLSERLPAAAEFRSGRITRTPDPYMRRPETSVPRLWMKESSTKICTTDGDNTDVWIIVCYTTKGADNATLINYLFWQMGSEITIASLTIGQTPTWEHIFSGQLDEMLRNANITPEAIVGAYVSPVRPLKTYSWQQELRNIVDLGTYDNVRYAAYKFVSTTDYINIESIDVAEETTDPDTGTTIRSPIMTDDYHKIQFYDTSGAVIYTAPWGVPFRWLRVSVDCNTINCNLQIYLSDSESANDPDDLMGCEGRYFTFPLPSLPITSNAWSEYQYTGQRDYDIRMREIQRDQSAANGISGAATGALGGAMTGALVGAAGGPIGAAAGAAIGLGASLLGTGSSWMISGSANRKEQKAVDKLVSNQTAALISASVGLNGLFPQGKDSGWQMTVMARDDQLELKTTQQELGYVTDYYSTYCYNEIFGTIQLVDAGERGGVSIEGLEVRGVCNKGKTQISDLFYRGVHIDHIYDPVQGF